MNTKIARLVRSICLSVLFVMTFFSLFQGRGVDNPTLETIHIIAGSLLLIGSLVHLVTNIAWIRTAFSRPASQLPKRVRALRFTDLALFISATFCAGTGGVWLLSLLGVGLPAMEKLHTLSGMVMSLILFTHLIQHWGWLVGTLRSLGTAKQPQETPAFKESPLKS